MNEFKVGDWVRVNNGKPHQFKRFTKDLPGWNKNLDYENIEMLCHARFHIPNFDRSIVTLWEPTKDEWCWFYKDGEFPSIAKFDRKENEHTFLGFVCVEDKKFPTCYKPIIVFADIIEPFIGNLPSMIKDNK